MNWLYNIWYGYGWPSLKGNGPEALVQTIVYGIIAIILIPPVRRWFKAEYQKVHDRLDHAHERQEEITRHLQHIIKHHPDIPPLPPKDKHGTT